MTAKPRLRCAIYTRKSSDEGLDQAFNSLDAQREAGEAYVRSQSAEGWRPITTRYDDGGFSGGSMERPALQRLMADVDAGLIDVVVVYKIDRLTRSLADFARIVERFDARSVSFVNVTQSFNTTSSMGRLTLNVLLSFAQFEREVTGERIRDKIAASKAKGMWMGGVPPLGYDLPATGSRALRVNDAEAATVRHIFSRYVALGSVYRLAEELTAQGITSKQRMTGAGNCVGGQPLSRGALFHLLKSRIYLGQIPHKGTYFDGQHDAIVSDTLFLKAQALLASQTRRSSERRERSLASAPLSGRVFDSDGHPMSPTHARGKTGKIYRYYVSAPLQQGATRTATTGGAAINRVSAPALEEMVKATLSRIMPNEAEPLRPVVRLELHPQSLRIQIKVPGRAFTGPLDAGEQLARDPDSQGMHWLSLPIAFPSKGPRAIIAAGRPRSSRRDPVLIAALRRAHATIERDALGPHIPSAPASQYARRLIGLALLAPDIQREILAGRQPRELTLASLMAAELSLDWAEQRRCLGFHAAAGFPAA